MRQQLDFTHRRTQSFESHQSINSNPLTRCQFSELVLRKAFAGTLRRRNKATRMLEELLEGEAEQIGRMLVTSRDRRDESRIAERVRFERRKSGRSPAVSWSS
jgi:hypothetical protein